MLETGDEPATTPGSCMVHAPAHDYAVENMPPELNEIRWGFQTSAAIVRGSH